MFFILAIVLFCFVSTLPPPSAASQLVRPAALGNLQVVGTSGFYKYEYSTNGPASKVAVLSVISGALKYFRAAQPLVPSLLAAKPFSCRHCLPIPLAAAAKEVSVRLQGRQKKMIIEKIPMCWNALLLQ